MRRDAQAALVVLLAEAMRKQGMPSNAKKGALMRLKQFKLGQHVYRPPKPREDGTVDWDDFTGVVVEWRDTICEITSRGVVDLRNSGKGDAVVTIFVVDNWYATKQEAIAEALQRPSVNRNLAKSYEERARECYAEDEALKRLAERFAAEGDNATCEQRKPWWKRMFNWR